VSFAGGGKDTRTTQTFITFADSDHLGKAPWETPIGYVSLIDMKNVVDKFYSGYGDMQDFGGSAPDQGRIRMEGGKYVKDNFPKLDFINRCELATSFKAGVLLEQAEQTFGRFWSVCLVLFFALVLVAIVSIAARAVLGKITLSSKHD